MSELSHQQQPDQNSASTHLGAEITSILSQAITTSTLTHTTDIPPRTATYAPWPEWSSPHLIQHLQDNGIEKPYAHQAELAENIWGGNDTIISTSTASGKSLGYQLPILSALTQSPETLHKATTLYLSPTKALAQDQRASLQKLASSIPQLKDLIITTYDGDTPQAARKALRDQAQFIITNPDMVHYSILSQPDKWGRVLRNLSYLVIDEAHTYRGVFGAHVSLVLRRILRLAQAYGAHPTVVLASATVANPQQLAQRLTGRDPIHAITQDTSPQGWRTINLWDPKSIPQTESSPTSTGPSTPASTPVKRSSVAETAHIMGTQILEGARTLSFVHSRQGAEQLSMRTQHFLEEKNRPDLAQRIAAYRAGYTPQDRRMLEKKLDNGELLGVASTNALELGIDVGGLDSVICCGYPGTIASFWQQAGRAGRRGQGSVVHMVARSEPLDNYLVHHPEALLDKNIEASVFDPHNPYILEGHILCAATELPLTPEDIENFGAADTVQDLIERGLLRQRPRGLFPARSEIAQGVHHTVDIRGEALKEVILVDMSGGEIIGQVNQNRAQREVYPGARYFHQGHSYVVKELDLENNVSYVSPESPEWTTHIMDSIDVHILDTVNETYYAPGIVVSFSEVKVEESILGFRRRLADGTILDQQELQYPPSELFTKAATYTVSPIVFNKLGIQKVDWPGTLHAAEHAAIGMLPLLATCDRWDLGGLSTALHTDTGEATVFVYDAVAGGAGFSEYGYSNFQHWMQITYDVVRECPCEHGCPSCIQSPKCGNGNEPLDKQGAIKLLGYLCSTATLQ